MDSNSQSAPAVLQALVSLYSEAREEIEHRQKLCASLTYCILLLTVGALGIVKIGDTPWQLSIFLSIVVVLLGLFGARLTRENCDAGDCQREKAHVLLGEIGELVRLLGVDGSILKSVELRDDEFLAKGKKAHGMWVSLNYGIVGFGISMILLCSYFHWFHDSPAS